MIEVKDLLKKFEHILLSEESKKESVCQAISEVLGISIDPKAMRIQKNTIYLDLKPIYKTEIFLKHERILRRLQELLKNPPHKIR
jgi:hypothetical protein